MKKIFLFIAILSAFISKAQFPNQQSLGTSKTEVFARGAFGADSGFVYRTNFPDTIEANKGFIKNIPGMVIRTGNILWLRNQTVNAWIEIGTGAAGGSDTSNISIERGGSGVRIWWDNFDTLMLKDITGVNFINATTKTDSTLQVALDTGLTAYKDYINYYSAGGIGSGFTPGSAIFVGTDGSLDESPTVFHFDKTNSRLGIGNAAPTIRLDVSGVVNTLGAFINTAGSAPETGGFITVGNNDGSPLAIGDRLGGYLWRSVLSTGVFSNSASIEAYADGTHTSSSTPTKLKIMLSPSGSLVRDTVLSLSSAGQFRLDKIGSFTSADSTTYKPAAFDATGNAVRMTYWPGTGSGGSGETNTASNLGGGLANWDSKSGVDLRFNSFDPDHFDLTGNLISIDPSVIGGSASDAILNKVVLTSGTTWTTAADITTSTVFKIIVVGGGGGGGGHNTSNGKAAGGGGGGALVVYVSGLSPSTGYTYAIGAAGTAGAVTPTDGGAGGNTTLTIGATTYTGNGGAGGSATGNSPGGAGGTATNGDINITGQNGGGAPGASAAAASTMGGSPAFGLGMGGAAQDNNGNGFPGTGYGAGGGGGSSTNTTGGAGTQGAIVIEYITGGGGGGGTYTAGYGLTLPASAFILDTTIAVNKAGAQVISGAKNYTSASNKFSGLATDNTATKFVVAATDGTLGTQTIQTLSAYTGVDSLMSGQYTPTLANVTNVAGVTAVLVNYQKVGSIVHVQGVGSCTVTASGGTLTTMSITLPFASAMTLVTDCAGSGTARTSAAALPAYVTTNTTTDVAEVSFYSGSGSHDVHFSFTYKVK